MIVDLVRNDLGRVATTGSVVVDGFERLVTLPTVHHLVSTVRARTRLGLPLEEILRATLAGRIDHRRAQAARGRDHRRARGQRARPLLRRASAGSAPAGSAELALAIRTAVVRGGELMPRRRRRHRRRFRSRRRARRDARQSRSVFARDWLNKAPGAPSTAQPSGEPHALLRVRTARRVRNAARVRNARRVRNGRGLCADAGVARRRGARDRHAAAPDPARDRDALERAPIRCRSRAGRATFGDLEASLGHAVATAAVAWADAHRGERPDGWQLLVELAEARAERIARRRHHRDDERARHLAHARRASTYLAQTQAHCKERGLSTPERAAPLFYGCMMAVGRELAGWLGGVRP